MTARLCIKIHERDNVAVAIRDLPKGTEVYRYGVCLGTVDRDLPKGSWINEKNLVIAPAPDLSTMQFAKKIVTASL